jgi:hypothetical protein
VLAQFVPLPAENLSADRPCAAPCADLFAADGSQVFEAAGGTFGGAEEQRLHLTWCADPSYTVSDTITAPFSSPGRIAMLSGLHPFQDTAACLEQLAERLRQAAQAAEAPPAVIQQIPLMVSLFHTGRRIAIVDDVHHSLQRLEALIKEYYPPNLGNIVEVFRDAESAAEAILAARDTDRPFDCLVSDLFMRTFVNGQPVGRNGDELVRLLLDQDYFLPGVGISGEWGDRIKAPLADWLMQANNAISLAGLEEEVARELKGLPFTTMPKYGHADPAFAVAMSIDSVSLLAARCRSFEVLRPYFANFRPAEHAGTPSEAAIARMAEIVCLFGEAIDGTIAAIGERYPSAMDLPFMALLSRAADRRAWSRATLGHFSDPVSGRSAIHAFEGVWYDVLDFGNLYMLASGAKADPLLNALMRDPAFAALVGGFMDQAESLHAEFKALSQASKKPQHSTLSLRAVIDSARGTIRTMHGIHKMHIDPPPADLKVTTEVGLLAAAISQLMMNGVKAVRGSDVGEVRVCGGLCTLREAPAEVQSLFAAQGLGPDEQIPEIRVRDNGIGIPQENLPRMFEDHFSTFGTSGWGLFFFKQTCERLGACFTVESTVGEGTVFRVFLPPKPPPQ